jgi:transcriptional regulator with XRE-family HTH domain
MARGPSSRPGPLTHAVAKILLSTFPETLLTQKQLGAKVGMSQSMVSVYLRGEGVLDLEQFKLLCEAMNIDPLETITSAIDSLRAGH